MINVLLIQKPVNWSAILINWLVSLWYRHSLSMDQSLYQNHTQGWVRMKKLLYKSIETNMKLLLFVISPSSRHYSYNWASSRHYSYNWAARRHYSYNWASRRHYSYNWASRRHYSYNWASRHHYSYNYRTFLQVNHGKKLQLPCNTIAILLLSIVMFCTIWYHLYIFKIVRNNPWRSVTSSKVARLQLKEYSSSTSVFHVF